MGKTILLPAQHKMLDDVLHCFRQGKRYICIRGASGTGKSYTASHLVDQLTETLGCNNVNYLRLQGDRLSSERPFFPFNREITRSPQADINSMALDAADDLPLFKVTVKTLIDKVIRRKKQNYRGIYASLKPEEIDIIFRLQYLANNAVSILVLDNFHWWDIDSLRFIHLLLSNTEKDFTFLENAYVIAIVTDDQPSPHRDELEAILSNGRFKEFSFEKMKFKEYCHVVKILSGRDDIPEDIQRALHSITNGHLEVTNHYLEFYNISGDTASADFNAIHRNSGEIANLITRRLRNLGEDGDKIDNFLRFASIIGLYFYLHEVSLALEKDRGECLAIAKQAENMNLVNLELMSGRFSHTIIRDVFLNKVDENKPLYHKKMAHCLKVFRPQEYLARAHHHTHAGEINEANDNKTLLCIYYLRTGEKSKISEIDAIKAGLPELHIEYIDTMRDAYSHYNERDYEQVIEYLSTIANCYHARLRAERDYLWAICLNRTMDPASRAQAADMLEKYIDVLTDESDVWMRLTSLLLSTYAHIDDYENAMRIENILTSHLEDRMAHDPNAAKNLNVLRRKADSLHSGNSAVAFLRRSTQYFGPSKHNGAPRNPIEYFMALSNLAGCLLYTGEFREAYTVAENALMVYSAHEHLVFPRHNQAMNNYLLSGWLVGELSVEEAVAAYSEMLAEKYSMSDTILLNLNKASLLASHGKTTDAVNVMRTQVSLLQKYENPEKYYLYNSMFALATAEYLSGNYDAAYLLVNDMTMRFTMTNTSAANQCQQKRLMLFQQILASDVHHSYENWMSIYHKMLPSYLRFCLNYSSHRALA